jgi:hypothetical protein
MSSGHLVEKLLPTLFCFSLAAFLGLKAYRSRRSENHPTVLCLTTSALLASIFNLYMMIEPVTLFVSIVIQGSLLTCLVFAKFGLDQYLNGIEYQSPFTSQLFIVSSICIVIISILCYFHQDNLGSIGDDASFRWSLELFASNVLFYVQYLRQNWSRTKAAFVVPLGRSSTQRRNHKSRCLPFYHSCCVSSLRSR